MKPKSVTWIVLIAAVGLAGWMCLHFSRQRHSKNPIEKAERMGPPNKKITFNQVHPTASAETSPGNLSASIQPLFAANESYPKRAAAARTITTNLTSTDFDALYSFLLTKSAADEDQNVQVLKNQLMDVLCGLNPPPAQLADLLAQIYHDRTQNEVVRDYAVQHLAAFFEKMNAAPEELQRARSFEITEAEVVLWEALTETDKSIAGTALLGLERMVQSRPDFDGKPVAEAALKMAQDKGAGELARVTALQVCAKMKISEAMPVSLDVAQASQSVPLRISAIGALGTLGGAEQISFLESLIQGADERLKLPAQHALNQINQRLSVANSGH